MKKQNRKYLIIAIFIALAVSILIPLRLSLKNEKNEQTNLQNQEIKASTAPIADWDIRVTKKPFGIWVSPANSPVKPERFTGYHTGTDFEIFLGEENSEVSVFAICDGILRLKNWVKGYGGVAIQDCYFKGQVVTVIYGHLALLSITPAIGEKLKAGQKVGDLGKGLSQGTDNERRHLHLGMHKGKIIDLRGYVQNKSELNSWIDPISFISAL